MNLYREATDQEREEWSYDQITSPARRILVVEVVGPVYRRVCFCDDMGWEHDADCFVEIGDTP